ncbi:5-formyltetrahydrofolate cyclo-ligase [Nocardioides zeae]|uniref:5-formyltetrahydrofolate cyclo-ligase n=1 Tax=Nocardioides imazamoxiresistens TaxID=3231893 RepID=A0ABU3PWH2_9ACTN|nr:5-formyltetrahydrofolate cyclo-ligase [Nocardioides zeae]MDT9593582.1 5-formyltetrahydrofolate cyclo-ligase [Nocardioides zeae]
MTPAQGPGDNDLRAAKRRLRREVLERRARRSPAEVERYADALAAAALAEPSIAGAGCVAAYVGVDHEPATLPLLDGLRDAGVRVLLPVLSPDWTLRWGGYAGRHALVVGLRGLREPALAPTEAGEPLAEADVVLLPGLAMGPDGMRLGRGGGAYDRALAALPAGGRDLLVVLHPEEVGLDVPAEPHDQAVDGALTTSGVRRGDGADR